MIGLNFFKKVLSWLSAGDAGINYIGSQLGKQSNNQLMNGLTSLANSLTGAHLTGAQQEANQMSAAEAEKERQWQEHMRATNFQTQVADMQAAGLNPALMYQNGGSSGTPSGASASSVAPSAPATLQELISLMKVKKELAILDAQKGNIEADTGLKVSQSAKTDVEADLVRLQKDYYPRLTDAQISEINANVAKLQAEVPYLAAMTSQAQSQAALNRVTALLRGKEAARYDALIDSTITLNNSKASEADKNAAARELEAAILKLRQDYITANHADIPASGWAAVAAWMLQAGDAKIGALNLTGARFLVPFFEALGKALKNIQINIDNSNTVSDIKAETNNTVNPPAAPNPYYGGH